MDHMLVDCNVEHSTIFILIPRRKRINNHLSTYGLAMRVLGLLMGCSTCTVTTWWLMGIITDNPVWISSAACVSGIGGVMLAALCWVAGEPRERIG